MKIPFTKLHGAKNDFLLTLARDAPVADLHEVAIAVCNRHTGIGADGWMIIDPTPDPGSKFDATIRLFNSDGSEPEISGNGTRCAAVLLARAHPSQHDFHIRTAAGIKHLRLLSRKGREYIFEMNMGDVRVIDLHATVQGHDAVILDCGNPQCALPVEDFDTEFVDGWRAAGASIEYDARFPKRTNVSFIKKIDRHSIEVRFWERGAGETNSSGTGSTGAAVAAVERGFAKSPVTVHTPAGPLTIRIKDGVWLTGPAEYVAEGFVHYGTMSPDE